jgi:proteic killer suppression protein
MIKTFKDKNTYALFERNRVIRFRSIERQALRRLVFLDAAARLEDLKNPPSNRFEKLGGDLKDLYSLRINKQWRVCFRWKEGHAHDVEIVDDH